MAKIKKIVLVTGASSGIGEALSRELVKHGYYVIGIARSIDKLMKLKSELGDHFYDVSCDLSKKEEIEKVCYKLVEERKIPTIFYLNAGLAGEDALEDKENIDSQLHEKMMAVNYFGVLRFIDILKDCCVKNGGAHFIVTSSVNAIWAPTQGVAYGASKAAIASAFKTLSLKYHKTPLIFSTIYAGPVATKGLKGKLPFTWTADEMAKYMIAFQKSGKRVGYPSWFYTCLTWVLSKIPNVIVSKLF
jgi:NADP-dependent 3-hydroxy acid dehydrogenase YdfG